MYGRSMVSKGYVALAVVGILVMLAGVAFIALDLMGKGDSSGIDPKDVGIVVVGLVLAALGGVLSVRKKPASPPAPPAA